METELYFPIDVDQLIPHRKPMCLIECLVEVKDQSGTVMASVLPDNVLLDDNGRLDRMALPEMIAQAYAAIQGYAKRMAGKSIKQGFLVGIRKFTVIKDVFLDDHIMIHVNTIKVFGGFALAHGEVLRNDELIASGTIKLWIPEAHDLENQTK